MKKNVALCGVSCSNNFFNNQVFLAMLASMLWKLWNWRFFINRMFSPPKHTIHFCRTALLLFRCLLLCILSTYKYLEELKNAMIRYLIICNFCLLPFMHWQILNKEDELNNDSREQQISFKILQTACFHFFTFTQKSWLIDWLKDLRWIMIPEEKKIPLIWDFAN